MIAFIVLQVTALQVLGFECSLESGSLSTCGSPNPAINLDNLAAGQQHSFEVRAVDTQGNKS